MKHTHIIFAIVFISVCVIVYIYRKELGLVQEKWIKPVKGTMTSRYGYRTDPVNGGTQFHNGLDLAVPVGTKVVAAKSGKVITSAQDGTNGNYIIIEHADKSRTSFAHLSYRYVKNGDKVRQGQLLGLTGNTGKSTGPHVHIVYKDPNGNTQDPEKVLYA